MAAGMAGAGLRLRCAPVPTCTGARLHGSDQAGGGASARLRGEAAEAARAARARGNGSGQQPTKQAPATSGEMGARWESGEETGGRLAG